MSGLWQVTTDDMFLSQMMRQRQRLKISPAAGSGAFGPIGFAPRNLLGREE